jgi:hypothetical protein
MIDPISSYDPRNGEKGRGKLPSKITIKGHRGHTSCEGYISKFYGGANVSSIFLLIKQIFLVSHPRNAVSPVALGLAELVLGGTVILTGG